jgi:hypothetical protein
MRERLGIGVVLAAVLTLSPSRAAAVTAENTPSTRDSQRALNGHLFQPSLLITGPFATTSFGVATQLLSGDTDAPTYDLRGNVTGSKKYTLAGWGESLLFDLRVYEGIALRLRADGLLFTATSPRGILAVGGTGQYGFTVGVTAGLNLSDSTRLAFVGDFGIQPQLSLLIGQAMRTVLSTGVFGDTGLTSDVERVSGVPGASFAWAPSPLFGLIAEASYVWTRHVSGADSESVVNNGFSLAGLVTFDFDPLASVPVALQASYRAGVPVTGTATTVQQAALGIYYSRRAPLALGLELIWRHGQIRPGVEPTLTSNIAIGTIWFRYYW